jgi:hypothetical protein
LIVTLQEMPASHVAWLSGAEHFSVVRRMLSSEEPSYDQGREFSSAACQGCLRCGNTSHGDDLK